MRIDVMRDLDLTSTPLEYDDSGFAEAAALRSGYGETLAQLRRDVKPGSPTWAAKAEAAQTPVSQRAAWLEGVSAHEARTATALAEARIKTLSRRPTDPVTDTRLARIREGWSKVDVAQRRGQLLQAARAYAAGQHTDTDEAVIQAALTDEPVWGAPVLFDDQFLAQVEATVVLPEVGGRVWRAKLAARLAEGLREVIGEAPAPILLARPGRG